jgi:hypothetical protein
MNNEELLELIEQRLNMNKDFIHSSMHNLENRLLTIERTQNRLLKTICDIDKHILEIDTGLYKWKLYRDKYRMEKAIKHEQILEVARLQSIIDNK